MKKFLFLVLALALTVSSYAQLNGVKRNVKATATVSRAMVNIDLPVPGEMTPNSILSGKSILTDPTTMVTIYDLQTNGSMQHRCYLYPDGTLGAACTFSQSTNTSFPDRGTGYNYFDGTAWGAQPTARIESIRTGWPEYQPFGANGEIVISHQAAGSLVMSTRTVRGTGAWTQTILPAPPSGVTVMLWPRMVTNGTNNTNIHVLAITEPVANGGTKYNGLDGALLYINSLDGGVTWSNWTQPTGLTSSNYWGLGGDTYAWAQPHGDTLAFVDCDPFFDLILEKSTDNGTTWTQTIVWHSLTDLGGSSPHFFYCPDESAAIALDNAGMAHIVFGLAYDSGTANVSWEYNFFASGVGYWNESQPQLRQDLNFDSLYASGNLVGWVKDTNVFNLPVGEVTYWNGASMTSKPTLVIDNNNKIFLAFSGATTLLDPNSFNMRHIFGRDGVISPTESVTWHNDTLVDITGDWLQYNFSECMFPSASPTSDDYVYILFQSDAYGGSYVQSIGQSSWHGQTAADSNYLIMIKWEKPLWIGVNEKHEKPTFSVGQNFPNPVNGMTTVNVYIQNAGDLSLKVTNLTGQTLMTMEKSNVQPGVTQFAIDASQLSPGVYFYSVKQGDKSITKKMIIE